MFVITFTHDIYNYVPATSPPSKVYSVAAVLWLHYVLHVVLFPMFSAMHCTVLSHQHFPQYVRSAQDGCFLQFLNFALSGMLLKYYCMQDCEMVPVAVIIIIIIITTTFSTQKAHSMWAPH
jgi:hypothetical protein